MSRLLSLRAWTLAGRIGDRWAKEREAMTLADTEAHLRLVVTAEVLQLEREGEAEEVRKCAECTRRVVRAVRYVSREMGRDLA